MRDVLNRYKFAMLLIIINILFIIFYKEQGINSINLTKINVLEMLKVVPPIFVLLGLMDTWVNKETMMKYMGKEAGFIGGILAFLLGSLAAGPLYAAFPIAGMLLKKGTTLFNVFIFVGAWSTTKIPLLLFEASSMGIEFTIIRFMINLVGIVMIAKLSEGFLSKQQQNEIYTNAESL